MIGFRAAGWIRNMSMRGRLMGACAVALAALLILGAAPGFSGPSSVPLGRVSKERFVRQVVASGTLKAVKASPINTPSGAEKPLRLAWIIEDGNPVKAGEPIARFDPTDFENQLADGQAQLDTVKQKSRKAGAESDTTMKNLERDASQAALDLDFASSAQSKDPRIFSRMEIVKSELDVELARSRKEHAGAQKEIREKLARADENLLEIEGRKAGLAIRQAQQGLKSLEVLAPNDGYVSLQRDWNGATPRVGDVWWPGSKLGEIPEMGSMEAEIYVLEADAGGLAKGKRAWVTLDSKPEPRLEAQVSRVDALAKPRIPYVPVQYFGATLSFLKPAPMQMKPGERITVLVTLDEIPEALMVPREAVFERGGKKIVYRKEKWGRFAPSEVALGSADLGRVVVLKGVEEGDWVALCDPTRREVGSGAAEKKAGHPAAPQPGGGR